MAKEYDFSWQIDVPKALLKGQVFDKWDEETGEIEFSTFFCVDEYGFFLYWLTDNKDAQLIDLIQLSEARLGCEPKDLRFLAEIEERFGSDCFTRTITLVYGLDFVNIFNTHIIAQDLPTALEWLEGLQKVLHNFRIYHVCPQTCLLKHWKMLWLSVNDKRKIPVRSIARTFASGKAEKMVIQCLIEMGLCSGKKDEIEQSDFTFEKFYELYLKICPRTDVQELFNLLSNGAEFLGMDKLIAFLNDSQRDPRLNEILFPHYDRNRALQLVSKYDKHEDCSNRERFCFDGFLRYLMSDDNAPVFLDRIEVYQQMDQPLCHYFINSSHNTYLIGRQFGGRSSVEIYRQVLLAGCRCIELDCWDGTGDDRGEPIITHGKAMCTDVLFKLESGIPLPSPMHLRRKILIKNKRLKPDEERKQLEQFFKEGKIEEDVEENETPEVMPEEAHPELKTQAGPEVSSFKSKLKVWAKINAKEPTLSKEEEEKLLELYHYTGATTKVHPLLSSIVNYTHPVRFQSFEVSEQTNCHFHMSSFSESTGLGLLKTSAFEFVNYNKRQLARIYPKGGRVDSSNFLPQIFWNAGVQLVALNFQTSDLAMQLNQGRFEYNGSCGYLLKPDFMRRPDRMFDPFSESPVDGVIAAFCSIKIISGQFLSERKTGTYVEVEMYGLPTDTIRKEYKTRIVPANGLNPFYNEEPFVFRKIVLPELAVFRIAVYDENNRLLGQRILPLDGLQAGYRHISLRTETSVPMTLPTIFCHIQLKTYVPKGLAELVNALADPKAHLLEKRQKQMEQMGIEKEEIEDIPVSGTSSKVLSARSSNPNMLSTKNTNNASQHSNLTASGSGKSAISIPGKGMFFNTSTYRGQKKKGRCAYVASNFETTRIDDLKKEKAFLKLLKKHKKEMDEFDRLIAKRQLQLNKQQSAAIEKLLAEASKCRANPSKLGDESTASSKSALERRQSGANIPNVRHASAPTTPRDQVQPNTYLPGCISHQPQHHNDPVQSTVSQQTTDFSNFLRQRTKERFALEKTHLEVEWNMLKKLLAEVHDRQLTTLRQRLDAENKELKQRQTKKSMEDSKAIYNDKTIKTKGEKDRRVKEIQEQNLKLFMEERRRLLVKHQKPEDQLRKCQVEEKEMMEKEAKKANEHHDAAYKEAILADKPQTLV
uniref:1-phosphatidylinositol 4,5-bisphosphate phosphodiesterase n=1 Tax=Romanomermis culicivorax TaxID=13658 RepID=A0A915JN46_ROMCU